MPPVAPLTCILIVGSVTSENVIHCVADTMLPNVSLAVQVTVVVPVEKLSGALFV